MRAKFEVGVLDEYSWASAVGRIRVLEGNLLTKGRLRQFAEAQSLEAILASLRDSPYGPYVEELLGGDFDHALDRALTGEYEGIAAMCPQPEVILIFRARYDFHNGKVMARRYLFGMPWEEEALSAVGNVPKEALPGLFEAGTGASFESAVGFLRDNERMFFPNPMVVRLVKNLVAAYVKSADEAPGLPLDGALDRAYYTWAKGEIGRLGYGGLTAFITKEIDMLNLRMAVRAKRLGISQEQANSLFLDGGQVVPASLREEYGKNLSGLALSCKGTGLQALAEEGVSSLANRKPLGAWEKSCDNALMEFIKKARYQALGPEPVFGYLYGRETEVKNLRVILTGKTSGIAPGEIVERLREPYA